MANALLYNLDTERGKKVKFVLFKLKIRYTDIPKEQFGQTIGYLAGREGFEKIETNIVGGFDDELIIMNGFDPLQLDSFLANMHQTKITVPLKALVTPDNAKWNAVQLRDELYKEYLALKEKNALKVTHKPTHKKKK